MVRSFLRNGRKPYGTGSSRERHDRASVAPPVQARWRGHAVRAAIQRSQASLAQLSRELGINPKTVAKWRKRATVEDMKTGPSEPRSTVLTEAEEATVVAYPRPKLCHTPALLRPRGHDLLSGPLSSADRAQVQRLGPSHALAGAGLSRRVRYGSTCSPASSLTACHHGRSGHCRVSVAHSSTAGLRDDHAAASVVAI
jgi:hypothetical protein